MCSKCECKLELVQSKGSNEELKAATFLEHSESCSICKVVRNSNLKLIDATFLQNGFIVLKDFEQYRKVYIKYGIVNSALVDQNRIFVDFSDIWKVTDLPDHYKHQ